jgi:hypothetical protein
MNIKAYLAGDYAAGYKIIDFSKIPLGKKFHDRRCPQE